jgi:hypothetical protein
MVPSETQFLVVPDPADRRVGSGGATIKTLGVLGKDREWWNLHRALLVHSGGDSRSLPQFSPGGKMLGVLPSRTRPRGTTTVFDETMTLSAAWAERVPNGLLVAAGDVVWRFDAKLVQWDRPGVTGVTMRLEVETGSHHEGRILLDGVDLSSLDQEALRRRMSVLFQDPVHYHASVRENIAFGDIEGLGDQARVWEAARNAGALEPIERLKGGFRGDSRQVVRRRRIERGEWQRIALARAFFSAGLPGDP